MKFWHNNLFCLQIQEYTTMHALVMEYIEGPAIDDKEKILSDGYDMGEIDVMEVKMDYTSTDTLLATHLIWLLNGRQAKTVNIMKWKHN